MISFNIHTSSSSHVETLRSTRIIFPPEIILITIFFCNQTDDAVYLHQCQSLSLDKRDHSTKKSAKNDALEVILRYILLFDL